MSTRLGLSFFSVTALAACSCGAPAVGAPPPTTAVTSSPTMPSFEVHEWGLVRGTTDDHVMISGPHAPEPVVVMAKPVIYVHRDAPRPGDAALEIDVEVTIHDGRVVEHWPLSGAARGASIAWHAVLVQDGSCSGSRYPTVVEPPCVGLPDGCEAATLAGVETHDSDCLTWPQPPDGEGPTEAWNHLFYRAERTTAPPLPLRLEPQADGTLRVTSTTGDRVPGRLIRVHRSNGAGGVDGAAVADPPTDHGSITIGAPTGPLSSAAEALSASLREAGLTEEEVAAFRRAWDEPLFGATVVASADAPTVTATITTAPVAAAPMPIATTSVLYVLPLSGADALSSLHITPAPSVVRRAIVIWLDERRAP